MADEPDGMIMPAADAKWGIGSHLQLVFLFQCTVLLIIIVSSIVNLSLGVGDATLWQTLLASAVGFALPNPNYKCTKKSVTDDDS